MSRRLVLAVLLSVILAGCSRISCSTEWGKRLEYAGSSLFYTPLVTEAQARKLGDYLLQSGFFQKGNRGSVQITKEGDVYQFRMIVKEGTEKDMEFMKMAGLFAANLSRNVFEGKAVEMHLCDKQFKTLQVVAFQIR